MDHSLQVDAAHLKGSQKVLLKEPRFITATAKSLCWLIWSQAKKFQEVWDVSGNDFGQWLSRMVIWGKNWTWGYFPTLEFMRQPKKFHSKVRRVLFFINRQCLFTVLHVVKAVAGWCNEDEVEIVSFWFQSLPKFMYAPGTWKKHPKLSRNMRISPRCSGPCIRYHSCLKLSANKESSLPKIGAKTHMSRELVGFQDLFGCFQK